MGAVRRIAKIVNLEKMLQNAPALAIEAVQTGENEPTKFGSNNFIISIPSLGLNLTES